MRGWCAQAQHKFAPALDFAKLCLCFPSPREVVLTLKSRYFSLRLLPGFILQGKARSAMKADSQTPALPAELLSRIITWLVPTVDRYASTLPHPDGVDLEDTPVLPASPNVDLLSAALSCKLLHNLSSQVLYRTPLLGSLKSLNLLAGTIAAQVKNRNDDSLRCATKIRCIHLPPGDGLLQPGDTLADQNCYTDSLRILFDHATRLDFVSLEHRQSGEALIEFLRASTVCRPRRITLSNLSFSAPPFSTMQSLAPLSEVTHLHLIKLVPPPALLSFLVGEQIVSYEQADVSSGIKARLSPRKTLECLRLSLLPPDALVNFEAYVAWRKAWKLYEQLSAHQQAHEPAPRAPHGPARRFAVQEALYDLAVHSSCLPRLRLLLLELSPLGALPSPREKEQESFRSVASTRSHDIRRSPIGGVAPPLRSRADPGANACKAQAGDSRATRFDASHFQDAMRTLPRAATLRQSASGEALLEQLADGLRLENQGGLDNDDAASTISAEELRIGERDQYWRHVESGKMALVKLWSSCQRDSKLDVPNDSPLEVRIVAARSNGHDRHEEFQDFYCQAQHEPFQTSLASTNRSHHHISSPAGSTRDTHREAARQVGCWADPDVFSLVETAPYLSFKATGASDHGWYWIGDLPRETRQASWLVIPSRISKSSASVTER